MGNGNIVPSFRNKKSSSHERDGDFLFRYSFGERRNLSLKTLLKVRRLVKPEFQAISVTVSDVFSRRSMARPSLSSLRYWLKLVWKVEENTRERE